MTQKLTRIFIYKSLTDEMFSSKCQHHKSTNVDLFICRNMFFKQINFMLFNDEAGQSTDVTVVACFFF